MATKYGVGDTYIQVNNDGTITIVGDFKSSIQIRPASGSNTGFFQTFFVSGDSDGDWWYLGRINNIDGSTTGGEHGYVDIELFDGRDYGNRTPSGTRLIATTRGGGLSAEHRHYGSLAYNSSDRSYFDIRNDGSDNFHVYLWMTAYSLGRIIIYTNNYGSFWSPSRGTSPSGTQVHATNTPSNMGDG